MAENGVPPAMAAALERLWNQFLPQIEERVTMIETAGTALADGRLTDEQRDGAKSAAHKLAGVLGTFGLAQGTDLARGAELLCAGDTKPATATELAEIAAQLRTLVSSRT
jgi:HPt (histidine-containing phosphotransfer) domain-containing protein